MRSRSTLTLNQALAIDRLEEFVRQEEAFGAELVKGSDFERALVLLITQLRNPDHSALTFGKKRSTSHAVAKFEVEIRQRAPLAPVDENPLAGFAA